MTFHVKELMNLTALKKSEIISGGTGLNREVKYVTVLEIPEYIKWLKGNELILTSLFSIKDDIEAQKLLIKNLYEVGTAALAIKLHPLIKAIPKMILDEAEKYNFPIIKLSHEVSYIDIIVPVMQISFNNKLFIQQDLDQVNQLLNEIAVNASGIQQLIESFSNLTKNIMTVECIYSYIKLPETPFPYKPLSSKQKNKLIAIRRPCRLLRTYKNKEVECIVAPIFLEGKFAGSITSWGMNSEQLEIDTTVLERASVLITLEFLKLKMEFDIEQQYKDEFFRDLFLNESINEEDFIERGVRHNFNINQNYECLVIPFEQITINNRDEISDILKRIENTIHIGQEKALVSYFNKHIVVLLPVDKQFAMNAKREMKHLYKSFEEIINSDLLIGIGRVYSGIDGVRKSFFEAKKAVMLGKTFLNDKILHFDDLGIYHLISQFSDMNSLKTFYKDTIEPLSIYDQSNDLDLINTLTAYFKNNESLINTSSELFIHVNTLKYRIRKIGSLTGYYLNNSEEKLMLHMGLKLYSFLKDKDAL
ncbi:PucR family transcriptional regulator [Metabacillus idriensis]|uniref:PucR family transcriptional regulator n=1 Tax=Metabacillus idriensis TaxID=324768 RepID=UPI001749BB5B|nr:PucR family transcriptional regulator [Metabacillus idriensis]